MKHVVFDCDGTLMDTREIPYRLFPGVKGLIQELARSCTLYVWTARGRSSTLRILQESGVVQYFDAFYTADDGVGKPHVLGLATLVGDFPKEDCWMIGDTTGDILGARNFGIKCIGAVWNGEASSEVLLEAGADFIATHPAECSKLIRPTEEG